VNGATKLKIHNYIDVGKYLRACQNIFAREPLGSAGPPNVNLGPPNIPESTRDRMLKLKTQLYIVKCSLWVQKFLRQGAYRGGTGPPNVNLGPPKISETT